MDLKAWVLFLAVYDFPFLHSVKTETDDQPASYPMNIYRAEGA
jgi:hypothetical protein